MTSCIDISRMKKKDTHVVEEDTSIKLSQSDISLDINATFLLNIVDSEEINYYWVSGNTNVVCVLGDGTSCSVMGVGAGESYVKVRDDIGNEGYCQVIVSDYSEIEIQSSTGSDINNYVEEVTSLQVPDSEITLKPKDTYDISPSVTPASAIKTNSINYVSTDPSVADVFSGGTLVAKSVGFATIQVSCGSKTQSIDVTVKEDEITEIQEILGVDQFISFNGRQKKEFTYKILPAELSYLNLSFVVEDSTVAKVSKFSVYSKIVVTSFKPGATILRIKNGNNTLRTCSIEVKELQVMNVEHRIHECTPEFFPRNSSDYGCYLKMRIQFKVTPASASAGYFYSYCIAYLYGNHEYVMGGGWKALGSGSLDEDGFTPTYSISIRCDTRLISSDSIFLIQVDMRNAGEYTAPSNSSELNNRTSYYLNSPGFLAPYSSSYDYIYGQ